MGAGKGGNGVGVEHQGPPCSRGNAHESPGALTCPERRPQDERVEARIRQDGGELGGIVAGAQHDRGEMGRVDGQRLGW